MIFFDELIDFRLRKEEVKNINMIIKNNPLKYVSKSEFIRIAIIKLIQQEINKSINN